MDQRDVTVVRFNLVERRIKPKLSTFLFSLLLQRCANLSRPISWMTPRNRSRFNSTEQVVEPPFDERTWCFRLYRFSLTGAMNIGGTEVASPIDRE